jgi:lipooligosaccharide transport system ATP-binding protein
MDEAEQLCDRLVVMDHGTFAAEGSPRDLIARYCSPEVLELRFGPDRHELAADKLRDFPAERAEVLADRSCSTSPTGTTPWRRSAPPASSRSPRSSGAARWKTCSCG